MQEPGTTTKHRCDHCASCPLAATCRTGRGAACPRTEAPWWPVYIFYTLLAFCVIRFGCTALSESMHLRPDYDANIYHIIGRGWMQGILPYAELTDLKGPLLFLQCGIGSLAGASSFWGASILQALIVGLGLMYACKSAALFVGRMAAMGIAGLLFVYTLYFSVHPSVVVLSLQYISLYWLLLCLVRKEPMSHGRLFAIGLFMGAVLLLKFNLVVFWLPLLPVYICTGGKMWRKSAVVLAGLATATLPMLLYMWQTNILHHCLQQYLYAAVQYGSVGIEQSALVQTGWQLLTQVVPDHLYLALPAWFNALVGVALLLPWLWLPRLFPLAAAKSYRICLIAAFVLCIIALFGGAHHFLHYYFTLHPFVLLSLVSYALLAKRLHIKAQVRRLCTWCSLLWPLATVAFAVALPHYVNTCKPQKGLRESRRATLSLVRILSGESFLCTEAAPCIYLYRLADCTPPIRHFVPLMTPEGYRQHHQEILDCVRSAKPRYLVCTTGGVNYTKDLIRQTSAPYRQVTLPPADFPPYPPGAAYASFCLFERY